MTNQNPIDYPSTLGQFGWEKVGSEDLAIPVIVRSNNIRYAPVRIVETEIIRRYESIPHAVFQCITLKSFYLTLCETKLLTNINFFHCNSRYGDEFFRTSDVIISAADVIDLNRFLNISNTVFTKGCSELNPKLGVIKLTLEQTTSILIPYLGKYIGTNDTTGNQLKLFVPMRIIEPYVVISNLTLRAQANDWDIMYLKMLAVYCENNSQQYITRETQLLSLDGLLYSRTNTPLEYCEYVPSTITQPQQIQAPGWCN